MNTPVQFFQDTYTLWSWRINADEEHGLQLKNLPDSHLQGFLGMMEETVCRLIATRTGRKPEDIVIKKVTVKVRMGEFNPTLTFEGGISTEGFLKWEATFKAE